MKNDRKITTMIKCIVTIFFLIGPVCVLQGCKDHKPIPTTPTAFTEKEFIKKRLNWMVRNTVEAYKRKAHMPHEKDDAAIKFLENACRLNSESDDAPPYEQQEQDGRAIIEAGNDDPLIALWYGRALHNTRQKPEESVKFIRKALGELRESKYPKIHSYFAARGLAMIMSDLGIIEKDEKDFLNKVAYRSLGESILSGEFEKSESPIAFRLGRNSGYVEVYGVIRNHNEVDPWLLLMFEGLSEISAAWRARGGGWADSVTDKGWKGFRDHLSTARKLLTKAWKFHPEYPEAAEQMIKVATGSSSGREFQIDRILEAIKSNVLYDSEVRMWFDRSIAAQTDYKFAYRTFLWGTRPRWGGSHKEMHDFALECLGTKRFDTVVPAFYLEALMDIGKELDNDNWRAPFRRPGVQEKLDDLFKGMLNEPSRKEQREHIMTQQALAKAWCGNYENAKQLLGEIGPDTNFKTGFGFDLPWSAANRIIVEAETRAFTGLQGELLKKAESLSVAGKAEEASRLFEQALEGYKGDKEVHSYLLQRIGIMRMGFPAEKVHEGQSILHLAVKEGQSEITKFLLEKGAEVNPTDDRGWTPLHLACKMGKKEIVPLLLRHRADPNARTKIGRTPLHEAVESGQAPVVGLILQEKGVDVNASAENGWTALHVATLRGFDDIAQQLLDKGADRNAKLSDGRTPMTIAYEKNMTNVIKILSP